MVKRFYFQPVVKFVGILFILSLLFSPSVFAQPTIDIFPSTHWAAKHLDVDRIHQIIQDNFDLADDSSPYYKVKTKIVYDNDGNPGHLVVHLLNKDYYYYETTRINLGRDYSVKEVLKGYEVQPEDMVQDISKRKAACPDSSVDMVFATCETGIPTAVAAVDDLADVAEANGYNVRVLKGSAENIQAYQNWLSCNNLILFGRVGHGSPTGIMVDDGTLSYTYFQGLSSSALQDKVIFINSCQVHNSPLQPAVVSAGVQKYIGGITNLAIGPSERVFLCWFDDVVDGDAMTSTLYNCNNTEPRAGTFGISGNGSDYLASGTDPDPGNGDDQISDNEVISGLSGDKKDWLQYWIQVPSGVSNLSVDMYGGSGDADLYVRFGAEPTTSAYDCRSWDNGNEETCTIGSPQAGIWYVGIRGYRSFSGASLTASH